MGKMSVFSMILILVVSVSISTLVMTTMIRTDLNSIGGPSPRHQKVQHISKMANRRSTHDSKNLVEKTASSTTTTTRAASAKTTSTKSDRATSSASIVRKIPALPTQLGSAVQSGASGHTSVASRSPAITAKKTPRKSGAPTGFNLLSLQERMYRRRSEAVGGQEEAEWPHSVLLESAREMAEEIEAQRYCPPETSTPDNVLEFLHEEIGFNTTEAHRRFDPGEQFAAYDGKCLSINKKCRRLVITPDVTNNIQLAGQKRPNWWPVIERTSNATGGEQFPDICFPAKNGTMLPEYVFADCDGRHNVAVVFQKRRVAENISANPSKLNVLLMQLDAVSLPQYLRSMKETQRVLASLKDATVFRFTKHHAVGTNSLNNKFPLYGGVFEGKPEHRSSRKPRWIFDDAHKLGYVNLWGSNLCANFDRATTERQMAGDKFPVSIGSNVQFMSGSILAWLPDVNSMVDHVLSPKMWCATNHMYTVVGMQRTPLAESPGGQCANSDHHSRYLGAHGVCLGSRHNWDVARQFYEDSWQQMYKEQPKFGVWTAWENHVEENYGSFWDDEAAARWLHRWYGPEGPHIGNNTFLVFNSDHGLHVGRYYLNSFGMAENRWPFMRMVVPNWWLRQNPEAHAALLIAQHSLVTAFDVHQTLKHVMSWPKRPPRSKSGFGESLLLPGLNPFRSCQEAHVESQTCVCTKWKAIAESDALYAPLKEAAFNEVKRLVPNPGTVCKKWDESDLTVLMMEFSRRQFQAKAVLVRFRLGVRQVFEVEMTRDRNATITFNREPLQITSYSEYISSECREAIENSASLKFCHCLI